MGGENMKFEYKNLKIAQGLIFKSKNDPTIDVTKQVEFEKALNMLGEDGWELIQMIQPKGFLGLGDVGYCVFKRQVD
jgi:hypothetical protein